MQKKWIYRIIGILLLAALAGALVWYQPWRIWQAEHIVKQLQSPKAEVRQKALTNLYGWRLIQRQRLLQQAQPQLLVAYEQQINNALAQNQWYEAQLWLQDLQRLYPQLSTVQLSQQKVSAYVAQQINIKVGEINYLLGTQRYLTPTTLSELQNLQTELAELAPDHALLHDKRVLYALLLSIDEALARADFNMAEQMLNWGLPRFPDESELLDREVQVKYRLAGRPAQVMATCLAKGEGCWSIATVPALFSRPWLLQKTHEYPWLADWSMATIAQTELGNYYRQQAMSAYDQQLFMQASVDLLRAAYFISAGELNDYWQWLAFGFIEREQTEYQENQQAQLSGLYHTLITQVAALDVVDAQNTIMLMQTLGADPWFIDQIALPMLGETYLTLAQQLAQTGRYEVAMRLLIAGERFLPHHSAVQQLLAEYKSTTPGLATDHDLNTVNPNTFNFAQTQLLEDAALQALGLDAAHLVNAAQSPPPMANPNEPCAATTQMSANSVRTCQDQISAVAKGPFLIVPPANNRFPKQFAISKYPVSIREYNYFCETSQQCKPRALEQTTTVKPKKPQPNKKMPGNLDLTDVQEAMQEYDTFCRDTGSCNTIEPHAQDMPITNVPIQDALNYARWLTTTTGHTYRLPSADEWRYAILSDEIYRCSSDTLLGLPKKMEPVQQGVSNRWELVHELEILREWANAPEGIVTIGPEKPENLPVCILPVNTGNAVMQANKNTGFRLVREIKN